MKQAPRHCELLARALGSEMKGKSTPGDKDPDDLEHGPETNESEVDPSLAPINEDEYKARLAKCNSRA